MVVMEPYIQNWYNYLGDGKIMGVKCRRCGKYEFPPLPVCDSCSGTEMEWVEMSGEAEMFTCAYSPLGIPPYHMNPVINGWFKLKEGAIFMSTLEDANFDSYEDFVKRLPLAVKAEIKQMDEDVSWPVFRLKEAAS
jgi:uncharacterized OB-fold protein